MTDNPVPRIFRLNDETISGIRSSKHISSLQGVILALLENSLDAKSNKVEILVDWPRGGCCVQDNGHGIPTSEFDPDGGLGRMHCTSKRHPDGEWVNMDFETHGTNGMFLAELASLSMLSITSKTIDSGEAAGFTLHNGRIIKRQIGDSLFDISMSIASARQHGTQIMVRDLFGNMPVRVKQRALAGLEDQKLWHEVKYGIVSLLLAWPDSCTVKLRDANSQSRMVTLASHNLSDAADLTKKNLHQLHSRSPKPDLRDALSLLFQAGYASPESRSRWVPLAASTSSITLKGLICLEPSPTKQCQFISIGIHPCTRSTTFSELYEAANQVFNNSDFGKVDITQSLNIADDRSKSVHGSGKQRIALKGVDRFASFCIQIHFKKRWHYTSNIVSSNLLTSIVHILETAISSWLEKNLFRPVKRNRSIHSNASKISNDAAIAHPVNSTNQPVDCKETKPDYEGYDDILRSHSRIRTGSSYSRSHFSHEPPNRRTTTSADGQGLRTSPITPQSSSLNAVRHAAPDPIPIATSNAGFIRSRNYIAGDAHLTISPIPTSARKSLFDDRDTTTQSSEDYGSIEDEDLIAAASTVEASAPNEPASCENQFLQWTDPISKRTYKVDSRTGTLIAPESRASASPGTVSELGADVKETLSTTTWSASRQLRLVERTAGNKRQSLECKGQTSPWLSELLQTWDNPIFKAQRESSIPTIPAAQITSHHSGPLDSLVNTTFIANLDNFNKDSGTQLSRTVLDTLEVINQVDKKFILCRAINIPPQPSDESSDDSGDVRREGSLVIVDQHAASERVIVERLLQEFYDSLFCDKPNVCEHSTHGITATKGIQFDVPEAESELFASYRSHFAVWGVRYEITRSNNAVTQDNCLSAGRREDRINVTSLPSVIAERCSNFPKLCIDMMRTEAWAIAEGTKRQVSSIFRQHDEAQSNKRENEANIPLWLKHLSSCPRGILDMINSRACRSAIMFNDVLAIDECRAVMSDLRRCTFPFVCAHGRASMVPLTRLGHAVSIPAPHVLGGVEELGHSSSESSQSLGSALSNWMLSESRVTRH